MYLYQNDLLPNICIDLSPKNPASVTLKSSYLIILHFWCWYTKIKIYKVEWKSDASRRNVSENKKNKKKHIL